MLICPCKVERCAYEIIMTIKEHPFLQDISGVIERFWDMFIIDALIGNTDRNNSNWGIVLRKDGSKELAPVYDNGNFYIDY